MNNIILNVRYWYLLFLSVVAGQFLYLIFGKSQLQSRRHEIGSDFIVFFSTFKQISGYVKLALPPPPPPIFVHIIYIR
jgi:hypothetical protein